MPLISAQDFGSLLMAEEPEDVVRDHIFTGEPFVFSDHPSLYSTLRGIIARGVGLAPESVILVGSAKLGFSLDPSKFGAPFSDTSDLDLLVVSSEKFDQFWIEFLRWHREHESNGGLLDREKLNKHKQGIYWGHISPTDLTRITEDAGVWFDVIRGLGRHQHFGRWKATVRLYRTWRHATLSQIVALRQIARTLS